MIDSKGYRANVGIIITNDERKLFWARRTGMDVWQFPQGGIRANEPVKKAMYRELFEETGLLPEQVEIIGVNNNWLHYQLPRRFIRRNCTPVCIGQKQKWYLLKLLVDETAVKLDSCKRPEFDHWCWIDFWQPLQEVIDFKRHVYKQALVHFEPILFPDY